MALCLKHIVLTPFHPGNILFQTMIVNSDVLLVPNILDPLAIFRNWSFHFTSLHILCRVEINKNIQKVWRYAALQWHNVITKYPENQ
jgi:hypothetical protein